MLLQTLKMENFGLYRGCVEIDLAPRNKYGKHRPVILIGGTNGAGKTTILEAIRLCLYGSLAIGDRVSQEEYHRYLKSSIYRNDAALFETQSATVGLKFEYGFRGALHVFSVERSWDCNGDTTTTELTVLRDGKPLDELERAHADEFLRDLIPPGVSGLFFFDGEKIQEMAQSTDDDVALAEAIRNLLGLDLVNRLNDDLSIYTSRLADSDETNPLTKELKKLLKDKKQLENEGIKANTASDLSRCQIDKIELNITRTEKKLAREGGGFAEQRESLKAEEAVLRRSVEAIEGRIREFCGELFPFAFATNLCQQLQNQLNAEKTLQDWQAHDQIMSEKWDTVRSQLPESIFKDADELKVSKKAQKTLSKRFDQVFQKLSHQPESLKDIALIHNLSESDRTNLLSGIDRSLNVVPKTVTDLEGELEVTTRRLLEVSSALSKVPADDVIEPFISKLNRLHKDLGAAELVFKRAEEEQKSLEYKISELKRGIERKENQLQDLEKGFNRRKIVGKVKNVLAEYADALTKSKVAELSNAVAKCFEKLWRKGDLLQRIEIDPTSCEVSLFDRNEKIVPKERLSAGEKQIYAISVLWALAKVSGRVLPMVIDTPLARLDSRHRQHLVERYFPDASHQVIILSTDTEIDEAYFAEMDGAISHAYHLEYDDHEMCTSVKEGYFWANRKAEVTA